MSTDKEILVHSLLLSQLPISIGGGIGLTVFAPLSLANWQLVVVIRVVWVLLSGLAAGFALAHVLGFDFDFGRGRLLATMAAGLVFGAVVSFNPIADLVQGPAVAEGALVSKTTRGQAGRRTGSSPTISASVQVRTAAGDAVLVEPIGIQASRWEDFVAQNQLRDGSRVRLTALEHLDVVLAVERR